MPAAVVLIIANPFEARVVIRAVEAAGMRAIVAEGGEGALGLLRNEAVDVVVLAQGIYYADEDEITRATRAHQPAPALLLIRDGRVLDPAIAPDAMLGRPINPTQLSSQLAMLVARRPAPPAQPARVGDENWWGDAPDGAAPVEEPMPDADAFAAALTAASGGPVKVDDEGWWEPEPADTARAAPTPVSPPPAASSTLPPSTAPARAPMLRLDDALGEHVVAGGPVVRGTLDSHLAAAERKLWGTRAPSADDLAFGVPDHIGVDSLPGIDDELGFGAALPPAAATSAAGPATDAPAGAAAERHNGRGRTRKLAPIDAALARLVPGRDAALTRTAIASAAMTPELDERAGLSDVVDTGDLARESVPELLIRLHRAGYTARLALRRGEAEKSIFFDGGFPVHATSSLPHDRLGELLWREGKITREQNARAQQLAERGRRRVVDALVEINALKRDELFKVMRHLVEEIIYSCFGWDRGSWSLGREMPSRDEKVSITHPYAIALEGIRRKYSLERLVHLVGPPSTVLAASATLWRVSADAALSTAERDAVVQLRRGPQSIHELRAAGRLDEIGAYALVHGLLVLGAVTFGGAASAAPDEGVEPAADSADSVPTEQSAAVDRERALAKYAQVLDGDYFGVLGVSRAASAYEIRRAWERTRADFAADRFAPSVRAELADTLLEIAEVVDEAWRALSDEPLRDAYRGHLATP